MVLSITKLQEMLFILTTTKRSSKMLSLRDKVISRKVSVENENLIKKVPFGPRGIYIKKQQPLLRHTQKKGQKGRRRRKLRDILISSFPLIHAELV